MISWSLSTKTRLSELLSMFFGKFLVFSQLLVASRRITSCTTSSGKLFIIISPIIESVASIELYRLKHSSNESLVTDKLLMKEL